MSRTSSLLLAFLLLELPGCGSREADVSGVVKYKGIPLEGGTISFFHDNKVYSAEIRADGSYQIKRVPVGTAQIAVVVPLAIPMPGLPPGRKVRQIPYEYGDPKKSGLVCEVRSGEQTHDVELR
jgi:hypothetical protein